MSTIIRWYQLPFKMYNDLPLWSRNMTFFFLNHNSHQKGRASPTNTRNCNSLNLQMFMLTAKFHSPVPWKEQDDPSALNLFLKESESKSEANFMSKYILKTKPNKKAKNKPTYTTLNHKIFWNRSCFTEVMFHFLLEMSRAFPLGYSKADQSHPFCTEVLLEEKTSTKQKLQASG